MQHNNHLLLLLILISSISLLGFAGAGIAHGASTATTCSNYCGTGAVVSACSGSTSISGPTTCELTETNTLAFTTLSSGAVQRSGTTPVTVEPQVSGVVSYNTHSAPNFLVCPLSAYDSQGRQIHPTDQMYFYTAPYTNSYADVAGDACLNSQGSLENRISLPTSISWSTRSPASASVGALSLSDPGSMRIQLLAYSPMLEAGGQDVISNGYDSNTPIFYSIPSQAQAGLWTWTAVFTNMSGYLADSFKVGAAPSLVYSYNAYYLDSNGIKTYYTCSYDYPSYGYSETTRLSGVHQTYIPYTENTPNGALTFDANVVPYLLYNFNISSPEQLQMNQSYDIFGPLNYYTPANSIDLFPVNTPAQFYINYGGKLISGSESLLSSLASFIAGLMGGAQMQGAPAYASGPISIAAIPNDFVFLLNYSSSLGGTYYLNVLRLIPSGYYNMSGDQPSSVCPGIGCSSEGEWASAWSSYWSNTITAQSSNTYLISTLSFGSSGASVCSSGSLPSSEQASCDAFIPINISADYYGDVFVTGYTPTSGCTVHGFSRICTTGETPAMLEVKDAIGSSPQVLFQTYGTNVPVLSEIAASPTGVNIFAAGPGSGNIYAFEGNDLGYQGSFSLSFSETNPITGQETGVLNISDYLYNGGLFGVAFNGAAAGNVLGYGKQGPATEFDRAGNHHPLGLQDVNGYLYVLDDWSAGLDWQACGITIGSYGYCPATSMNLLMLRVLNVSGANVPINPTLFNDVWQQQTCSVSTPGNQGTAFSSGTCYATEPAGVGCSPSACSLEASGVCSSASGTPGDTYACINPGTKSSTYYSLSTGSYAGNETYPPYGWVLAANVTTPDGASVSFCSSGSCTYNPATMTAQGSAYPPIGPGLQNTYSAIKGIGFSVNYNSTADIIMPATTENTGWGGICIPYIYCPKAKTPQYAELLTTSLNIENYTKLFTGYSPYTCYTGSSKAGACTGLAGIGSMAGPVYSVDNPFYYLENQGALQLLTAAGQFYSSLSSSELGIGGYKSSGSAPQLSISAAPVGWGQTDTVIATASATTDTVSINIEGYSEPVATGTGKVTYYICATEPSLADPNPGGCLAPGSYEIKATQVASDGSSSSSTDYTLTVEGTPYVSLQNEIMTTSSTGTVPDSVTAIAPSGSDTVEIVVPSYSPSPVASGTGNVIYTICGSGGQWCPSSATATAYTIEGKDTSEGTSQAATLYYVPAGATSSSAPTLKVPISLDSQIAGYLIVPYAYTYTLTQSYSPRTLRGTSSSSNPKATCASYTAPGTETQTVYTDALINAKSNTLSATVEGGSTYLQNLLTGSYYEPNISDYGLVVPRNIQYNAQGNRAFGSVYANVSECSPNGSGIDCQSNYQALLNATTQLQYYNNEYALPNAKLPTGYETLGEAPVSPADYGQSLPVTSGATPALFPSNTAALQYASLPSISTVSLFNIYTEVLYDSPLYLYLNSTSYSAGGHSAAGGGSHSLLGYQRIIYVLEDRFGNKFFAPIDADVANPVEIALTVAESVTSANANSTVLTINGIAGTYSDLGTVFTPLPAGRRVYLYYNKDLNYVAYDALVDPVNAIYCAFNVKDTSAPVSCIASNPVSATNYANSDVITYAPDYNSLGVCNPPPNSLLQTNTEPCNVYGALGLSATCSNGGNGEARYCSPTYSNGTGTCTSQLGLFGIATVGTNGAFGTSITACGYGQESIIAKYYGYPGPEPVTATQVVLPESENGIGFQSGAVYSLAATNVLNYQYAPNETVSVFQIGLPLLSYGAISIIALAASLATVLLLLLTRYLPAMRSRSAKRRHPRKD